MAENVKKKKPVFTFADVIILIILLAVIAVVAYVFLLSGDRNKETPDTLTIQYVVEIKDVRNEFIDKIKIGDHVIDSVALFDIGDIVAYEIQDSIYSGTNLDNGIQKIGKYPEKSNLYITIKAEAYFDEYMYSIDGYRISVGSNVGLKLPNFVVSGYCINLKTE